MAMKSLLGSVLIVGLWFSGGMATTDAVAYQAINSPKGVWKELPRRLHPLEVRVRMPALSDWTTDGKTLFYTRTFANFVEAVDFVNSLVDPAEQLGHHPDITINYNRVSLELTTHDAQGLTELDFQLATIISQM